MARLQHKVAVITGSGRGQGRAAAFLFAQEGARVVVSDINVEGGEETVRLVREAGGEAVWQAADVSQAAEVEALMRTAVATYGGLHVLYNNAAIWDDGGVDNYVTELSEAGWEKVLSVNLEVRDVFPRATIYAVDGQLTLAAGRQVLGSYTPASRLNSGSNGCMGVGVPFAIGAKLARPEVPVVSINGDCAFGFNAMEMETAVRRSLRVHAVRICLLKVEMYGAAMTRRAEAAHVGHGIDWPASCMLRQALNSPQLSQQ